MTTETVERTSNSGTDTMKIPHLPDFAGRGQFYALCGTKLLGIPCPNHPDLCVVCNDLALRDPFYRRYCG